MRRAINQWGVRPGRLRPEQLREDVEENLRALDAGRLAVMNLRLHAGDARMPDQQVPLAHQLEVMVQMREEGLIAGVGISTASHAQVEQAVTEAGVVTVQNPYSLLARDDEDVLEPCGQHGLGHVPYFPLGSAFPGTPKVVEVPAAVSTDLLLGRTRRSGRLLAGRTAGRLRGRQRRRCTGVQSALVPKVPLTSA